jgi:hypothetical protein
MKAEGGRKRQNSSLALCAFTFILPPSSFRLALLPAQLKQAALTRN